MTFAYISKCHEKIFYFGEIDSSGTSKKRAWSEREELVMFLCSAKL
jgi:hypothetical protein